MDTEGQPVSKNIKEELSILPKLDPDVFSILRLPDEVIAEILIQVREGEIRSMLRFHSSYWNHGGWPGYFFICWRIREVALHSSKLWARFALGDAHAKHLQRWIDLHLEKAGHRLCTVYLDLGLGELGKALDSANLDVLAGHTRELFIRDDGIQLRARANPHVHRLIGRTWPVLERMTLLTGHSRYDYGDPICLNNPMVIGAPDTLASLHLEGLCATLHTFPPLPNLRKLSILHCHLATTYERLCAGLLKAPRLVSLRVVLVPGFQRRRLVEMHDLPQARLALPDLRHVWISGLSGEVGYLLAVLPCSLEDLTIEVGDDSYDTPSMRLELITQVLDLLSQHEQRPHPVLHTVAIDQTVRDDLPRVHLHPRSPDEAGFGRVDLRMGQCDHSTLTLILERVSAAELLTKPTQFWIPIIEAAGECKGSTIEELHIHHWKDKRSTCIAALETYLQRRKERGSMLKKLMGNGNPQHGLPVDQDLVSRWLSQGWVTNIVEKEVEERPQEVK